VIIPRRAILCSFDLYRELSNHFPNREVIAEPLVAHGDIYYVGNRGQVRLVRPRDGEIYGVDYDRGFPWMKLRRKIKPFLVSDEKT
jgi:hypothetical protein